MLMCLTYDFIIKSIMYNIIKHERRIHVNICIYNKKDN